MKTGRTRKLLIAAGILISLWILVFLLLFLFPFKSFDDFCKKPFSKVFYDSTGQLLQVTALEDGTRREYISYKQLPRNVKKIFLKAEDKRFYFHNGTDLAALINATLQNLKNKKIVRGASTITMQLVKMTDGKKETTINRKLSNMFYARIIEARLSKKEILELYMNSIYFGHSSMGIASAARTFYGVPIQELNPQQICCLAVIPRNPSAYDPLKNKERCAQRASELYNKIYHKKTDAQDFLQFLPQTKYSYPFLAPHYIRYVSQKEEADKEPVTLSINLQIQQQAEKLVREGLGQAQGSRISNASLLLIENKKGRPVAWVGNADFFDNEHSGQIDGVLVRNQPGSSMKPFLYALALETLDENGGHKYLPSTIISDIPMEFGNEKLYIPTNFNNRYNGPVRLRVALASSLNVPAVSVLNDLGVQNYLDRLYELGFDSLRQQGEQADLGLALGAGEVSLKELVPAFAVFVRDGKNFDDQQIYETDTARLITSILSDKASRALGFGYTQTFQTDYPSIFKTGTSNQYQNIIALGATADYTIGVWMGNFAGETVQGKTGSSLPAWIARQLLDYLEKGKHNTEHTDFAEPQNWVKTRICSLSGMPAGPHCPATVYDYFPLDYSIKNHTCAWHKKDGQEVQTVYPPEYQQWARKTKPDIQIQYNSSPLSIQTPKDNSLFYYSELQKERQAITVEVFGGGSDSLEVYYDGQLFLIQDRPFAFQLPVEKGYHSCLVVCANEQEQINFTVK